MRRALLLAALAAAACDDLAPIHVPGPTVAHPQGHAVERGASAGQVALLARRNTEARVVAFRILFDAGSSDDPVGKEGATELAAAITAQSGTEKLTFAELSRALYPMAASIDVHVDRDQTVFSVDVASGDLDRFYPLLRDVILTPRLDDESFSRLRARQKSELEDELLASNDEQLGKEALQALVYTGRLYVNHPYAHPAVGTSSALAAMTLADVKVRRVEAFCKGRVTVGIAGAFPEGFDATVAHDFAALPACIGGRRALPGPTVHIRPGLRVLLVDKPSADATAISLGFPTAMTRASDDFPAAYFFTSWVGLHRQSAGLLYQRLREARGLNYGDYAYAEYFEQEGWSRFTNPNDSRRQQLVSIWLRPVKPANALFALRGALYYWRKAVESGIPDAEIVRFRTFLSRFLSLEQQTESRRLGFALDDKSYGQKTPFDERMKAAWQDLDSHKLHEVVARDLSTQDIDVAVVTKDAAALKKALLEGTKSPPAYDAPKPKEVTDEDALIEALPLGLKDADIKVVPVTDLFK